MKSAGLSPALKHFSKHRDERTHAPVCPGETPRGCMGLQTSPLPLSLAAWEQARAAASPHCLRSLWSPRSPLRGTTVRRGLLSRAGRERLLLKAGVPCQGCSLWKGSRVTGRVSHLRRLSAPVETQCSASAARRARAFFNCLGGSPSCGGNS